MICYNDNDPKACAWLRELIAAGELPDGDVDCRSITEIKADDLAKYDQCHFFAGVGFWALALQWAGLGDAPGIWTGSCPCQPFSCAGAGKGTSDERHLWPVFRDLIRACRPRVVFGEQVASAAVVGHVGARPAKAAGTVWLDGVRTDMEAAGYSFGASVLGAHSVGAPHIRQRCYWVAERTCESDGTGRHAWRTSGAAMGYGSSFVSAAGACRPSDSSLQRAGRSVSPEQGGNRKNDGLFGQNGATCRPPDAELSDGRCEQQQGEPGSGGGGLGGSGESGRAPVATSGGQRADGSTSGQPGHVELVQQDGGPSDVQCPQLERHARHGDDGHEPGRIGAQQVGHAAESVGTVPWSEYRVHRYLDGKDRRIPTEPRLFPLADDRHPWHRGRVGLLRGAGNAIVPALAAEFVRAWIETTGARQ